MMTHATFQQEPYSNHRANEWVLSKISKDKIARTGVGLLIRRPASPGDLRGVRPSGIHDQEESSSSAEDFS